MSLQSKVHTPNLGCPICDGWNCTEENPHRPKVPVTSKPGKYGTLYLHVCSYDDPHDAGIPPQTERVWAYDADHAAERFYDAWPNGGWRLLSVKRA